MAASSVDNKFAMVAEGGSVNFNERFIALLSLVNSTPVEYNIYILGVPKK